MSYRRTQLGIVILAVCLACGLLAAAIGWRTGRIPVIAAPIVLAALAVVFGSLTVEVDGRELRWYFGPGFWSYRLALDEIASVEAVRNHWWNGWGIRIGPRFRLYNVSGFDAVELRLKSGEVRCIGTDDPRGLLDALRAATGG